MNMIKNNRSKWTKVALAAAITSVSALSYASSHREAPMIAGMPRLDATDLYMFRSYEEGRENFVTIIANYVPLQDPYGGPNYFDLETAGFYDIHIDNDGDSIEDITFRFDFETILAGVTVPVNGLSVPIPLINAGPIGAGAMDTSNVNSRQEYNLSVILGDSSTGSSQMATNANTGASTFRKPVDYIGTKSIPNYDQYAGAHIYPVSLPGCSTQARVFVGQRNEGFAANLGDIFDLVNLNPLGAVDAFPNPIGNNSVTSLALEVPISCLTDGDPIIGAWTTSSLNMGDQEPMQVSRLGNPLVNEVIIGLPDKDKFNMSHPHNDAQFVDYVTNPTLPYLLEVLFADAGAVAPDLFPRSDLIAAITGVPDLNLPENIASDMFPRSEMLRLNTSIAAKAAPQQESLGVLSNDLAGFPNGRRPGDDVVDIALRVMMGALIDDANVAPNNMAPFTDQVAIFATQFQDEFPYLNDPLPGSAVGSSVIILP